MIIVDASVGVKWFINEPDSEKATFLLQGRQKLIAPDIIRMEVSSAVIRLYRMDIIAYSDTEVLLQEWNDAINSQVITLEKFYSDIKTAENIALKARHMLADCLYIAVALRLKAPLVTADRVQAEKARAIGVNVITLDSMPEN